MPTSITLHPLLCYSQHDVAPGHCCSILWDLREDPIPSVRHVSSLERPLPYIELSQYATSPPVNLLQIKSEILPDPWAIEARNAQGVTIGDVLATIYLSLKTPLIYEEWDRLSKKHQERINKVFDARWRIAPDPTTEQSQGIRRIDCLLHHTWFAGLSVSLETEHSYILSLRRPR